MDLVMQNGLQERMCETRKSQAWLSLLGDGCSVKGPVSPVLGRALPPPGSPLPLPGHYEPYLLRNFPWARLLPRVRAMGLWMISFLILADTQGGQGTHWRPVPSVWKGVGEVGLETRLSLLGFLLPWLDGRKILQDGRDLCIDMIPSSLFHFFLFCLFLEHITLGFRDLVQNRRGGESGSWCISCTSRRGRR